MSKHGSYECTECGASYATKDTGLCFRCARAAQLEAFVQEIENIETAWVSGHSPSQEAMTLVSEAWRKVRPTSAIQ